MTFSCVNYIELNILFDILGCPLEKNVTGVKWIGKRASFAVALGEVNDSNVEASPCPGQHVSNPLFHFMIVLLCGLPEWNEKHFMSFQLLQCILAYCKLWETCNEEFWLSCTSGFIWQGDRRVQVISLHLVLCRVWFGKCAISHTLILWPYPHTPLAHCTVHIEQHILSAHHIFF